MKSLSRVWLFATPWTAAPPMGFSRQEYWSRFSFPSPGIFPTQGLNPSLLHCRQTLYHLSHLGSPWLINLFCSSDISAKRPLCKPSVCPIHRHLKTHPQDRVQCTLLSVCLLSEKGTNFTLLPHHPSLKPPHLPHPIHGLHGLSKHPITSFQDDSNIYLTYLSAPVLKSSHI